MAAPAASARPGLPALPRRMQAVDLGEEDGGAALAAASVQPIASSRRPGTADARRKELQEALARERAQRQRALEEAEILRAHMQELESEKEVTMRALRERWLSLGMSNHLVLVGGGCRRIQVEATSSDSGRKVATQVGHHGGACDSPILTGDQQ
ncbi:unnamed protein product [Prorocentrum cordatum]|uniref:Uncharacterized protein n=1 Tax=Prorocentrum cordatum TaxID=2364126 RepID=A0ABN9U0D7_9DINO|nr:unnamed protein product [Polarella glacialis]